MFKKKKKQTLTSIRIINTMEVKDFLEMFFFFSSLFSKSYFVFNRNSKKPKQATHLGHDL